MMTPSKTVIVDIVGSLTGPVYHVEATGAGVEVDVSGCSDSLDVLTSIVISSYTRTADCVPLAGDETDRIVAWKGGEDLGHRDGQPVTLRFRMRSASLFAFELIAAPG